MNLAVWSGPRNLSTALMYAFAQRADCAVWDEPFYAAYLRATGRDHPMRAEILAAHEADPARVAAACAGPAPGGRALFYQKHMAHHLLAGFDAGWMAACSHVILIRHPARVIASYHDRRADPTPGDIGMAALAEVALRAEAVARRAPVVVDAADIRAAPEATLRALCAALGIGFDPAMLSWPAGGNAADGVWARHWYRAVHASTGFAPPEGALPALPPHLAPLLAEALPVYESLRARALRLA